MKKTTTFRGAIPALVTPFKKSGSIDFATLKKLVDFQIAGGVDAIVPCGSTGEAATLALEEYELIIKTVVSQAKKRVPIIAGAGSNDTKKAIHFSQIAKGAGADGLLHVTPFYNKPTPAGLLAHFKAVANATDLPIILYNVPGRTGANVIASTTLAIAKEVPQVVGVKEASGSIVQMMEIVKAAPASFSVLSGDDVFTLPLIAAGGHGCISVVCNEVPKKFSDMVHFAEQKDFDSARELHYELFDLMQANFIETNPQPVKTALALMGKIKEVFRLPLVSMSAKNKEILKVVLKKQNLI
jgi:4-hydroxy-tetrahydrodipicolinate synthase